MKPIKKYQEKFIALLKEAEEELGAPLDVSVKNVVTRSMNDVTAFGYNDKFEYFCDISTSGRWY